MIDLGELIFSTYRVIFLFLRALFSVPLLTYLIESELSQAEFSSLSLFMKLLVTVAE